MGKTILTTNQQKLINFLIKDNVFLDHFYLTGGTALSEFYLRHRFSEDLDFFSEQEIDPQWLTSLVIKLSRTLKVKKIGRREVFNRNLIFISFSNEVVKTEFTYLPSSQIEEPKSINSLPVDSLIDIAVNKFFTIYQKPSSRHFIDLYLILKTKKYKWEQLEKLARNKFDTNIDPIQLGSQLVKAETLQDLPKMIIKFPETRWRSYFIEQAKKLKSKVAK